MAVAAADGERIRDLSMNEVTDCNFGSFLFVYRLSRYVGKPISLIMEKNRNLGKCLVLSLETNPILYNIRRFSMLLTDEKVFHLSISRFSGTNTGDIDLDNGKQTWIVSLSMCYVLINLIVLGLDSFHICLSPMP